jgi:hypothetical protein
MEASDALASFAIGNEAISWTCLLFHPRCLRGSQLSRRLGSIGRVGEPIIVFISAIFMYVKSPRPHAKEVAGQIYHSHILCAISSFLPWLEDDDGPVT